MASLSLFAVVPRPKLPLRLVLIVPFVVQIMAAVGLTGYLAWRNGDRAVITLADQLMNQTAARISDRLDILLQIPHQVVQLNQLAIQQGTLDLNNPVALEHHFLQQVRAFPTLTTIGWANEQGMGPGVGRDRSGILGSPGALFVSEELATPGVRYLYLVNPQGKRLKLLHKTPDYNGLTRPWYQFAVKAGNQTWTPIYAYDRIPVAGINTSVPVYQNGKLRGVLTSGVLLSDVSQFLRSLNFSPAGQAFIMERSGHLVATSTQEQAFELTGKNVLGRLRATGSQDPTTRAVAQHLFNQLQDLGQLQTDHHFYLAINGQQHFAQVTAYQDGHGLDWLIVTVIPRSDFAAQIQENTQTTILLCVAAMLGAIALGFLTSGYITRPIQALGRASRSLAAGNWQILPPDSGIAELQDLNQTFNQTAQQLQELFESRLAAEATRLTEARFHQLSEAVPGMIYIYARYPDGSQGFEYVSSGCQEILELEPAELLAEVDRGLSQIHPEDRSAYDQAVAHSAVTLEPFRMTFRIISSSGQLKWLEASSRPVSQGNRGILWYGILQDVTERARLEVERQRSEQKLQESKHFIEQIANNSPQLLYIFDPVSGSNFYVNGQSREILGYTPEEIQQQGAQFFVEALHPEDLPLLQRNFEHWQRATDQEILTREVRFRHRDGSWRWLLSREVVFARDENQQVTKVLGTAQDITNLKQAEAALRESEQRFRNLFEHSPVAYQSLDETGRFIDVNDELCDLLGYTRQELLGRGFGELWAPEIRDLFPRKFACFKMDGITRSELYLCTKQGPVITVLLEGRVQREPNGKFVKTHCVLYNISDRRQMEEALRQSEERLRFALNAARMGSWDWDIQSNQIIWSESLEQMMGLQAGQFDGRFETVVSMIYPEDRPRVSQAITRSLEQGADYDIEFRFLRPDGSLRWAASKGNVLRNQAGQPVRMAGVDVDITDRKQVEFTLRENEARLRLALDLSRAIAWEHDLQTDVIFFPANSLSDQTQTLPFQAAIEMIHPDDRPRVLQATRQAIAGAGSIQLEYQSVAALGEETGYRWFQVHARVQTDALGFPTRIIGMSIDITERKQAELDLQKAAEAAEAASQAKSTFLANMSHELRTPLNAILGFSQLLVQHPAIPAAQREQVGIINRSGNHLLNLINDILEMSKIEAGRTTFNPVGFDLEEFLATLEQMFQLRLERKGLSWGVERSARLPRYIETDEGKLRQILINLLGNAVKFTQVGGVTLRVWLEGRGGEQGGEQLWFEVRDTGPGIDPEEVESLFEPFVQSRNPTVNQEGTGLGLPISRQFVRLLGGEMSVRSALGEGASFRFGIPVVRVEGREIGKRGEKRRVVAIAPGQGEYRILVVEDNWASRQLLVDLLEPLGFGVRTAGNGEEGIGVWREWEPDLVWMDMRMPVVEGSEATWRIREMEGELGRRRTTIIALTAGVFEVDRDRVLAAGCDDFVAKPLEEGAILGKLREHLGVEFVYEGVEGFESEGVREEVGVEGLEGLPGEWLEAFYQAVTRLNPKAMLQLVEQLSGEHGGIAAGLREKINNFDFEQLLLLVNQAIENQTKQENVDLIR